MIGDPRLDLAVGIHAGSTVKASGLEVWPATVVKSLGVLVSGARGSDLMTRALAKYPDNISLLKQAASIATGGHLHPSVMAA